MLCAVLGPFLLGCQAERTPQTGEATGTNLSVQWRFEPSPDERTAVEAAVERIRSRLGVSHLAASIDRFGTSADSFFVFVIPPPDYQAGHVFFGVVNTTGNTPSMSDLFDTGVPFGPRGVAVSAITDIDGDGTPDVLYCVPDDTSGAGASRAVALKNDAWQVMQDLPEVHRASCGEHDAQLGGGTPPR